MKNILKNTKNIENYTKQPIAQMKKNMLGIVKSVQKYSLQGTTQGNGLTGGLPPVRFSM